MENKEIEVRFLGIDKEELVKKLHQQGAKDLGEELLREIIFSLSKGKFIRIRKAGDKAELAYKHWRSQTIDGAHEIEFKIGDADKARDFIIALGFTNYRIQEKKRHKFIFENAVLDIDVWPGLPAYVEIEGDSEARVRETARKLGFDWQKAFVKDALRIIEDVYKIPVSTYKYFTFAKQG